MVRKAKNDELERERNVNTDAQCDPGFSYAIVG
jgi:hypothetical protein